MSCGSLALALNQAWPNLSQHQERKPNAGIQTNKSAKPHAYKYQNKILLEKNMIIGTGKSKSKNVKTDCVLYPISHI